MVIFISHPKLPSTNVCFPVLCEGAWVPVMVVSFMCRLESLASQKPIVQATFWGPDGCGQGTETLSEQWEWDSSCKGRDVIGQLISDQT